MFHCNGAYHAEKDDEAEQQVPASAVLVVITAEQFQIDEECGDEQGDEQYLSDQCQSFFGSGFTPFVPFLLKGVQNDECPFVDDFSTVDNLLSVHDKAVGPGDVFQQVVP